MGCCFVSYCTHISMFLTSNLGKTSRGNLTLLISLMEMKKLGPQSEAAHQSYRACAVRVCPK